MEELNVGRETDDVVFFKRFPQDTQRFGSVPSVGHDFGDERIVEHLDVGPLTESLLNPEIFGWRWGREIE